MGSHSRVMEYIRDYENIQFRVSFSVPIKKSDTINFAAQPFENMQTDEMAENTSLYLIYGKIDLSIGMHIGFNEFTFLITQDLHNRMGKLYLIIEKECLRIHDIGQKIKA